MTTGAAQTTTTLNVKVNARDLNRLDAALKKVFGTRTARETNQGFAELEKTVRSLTGAVERLTRVQAKQGKANEAYRDMRDQLRKARKEAEALRRELDRLRDQGQRGGGAGRPSGGRGGSWWPTGWGWPVGSPGGRPGGSGGGGWRDLSRIQVPDMTAGSMATAMMAIPGIGAIGAGALLGSYAMYGSALRYQSAFRDSYAHVRHGTPGGLLVRASDGSALGLADRMVVERVPDMGKVMYRDHATHYGKDGEHYKFLSGDRVAPMVDKLRVRTDEDLMEAGIARMVRDPYQIVAEQWGIAGAQGLQEAAQLGQAMGGRATTSQYAKAKTAQMVYGVDFGLSGGLMQAARYAGGDQDTIVARLIGEAVSRGLDGSKIAEYLSGMRGLMARQVELGRRTFSVETMMAAERRVGATGISSPIAATIAQGIGQGASEMGYGGGDPATQYMLLRELGMPASATSEDFAAAMLKLQNPEDAANAGLNVLQRFAGAPGLGENMRTLLTQRMAGGLGVRVHADAARQLLGLKTDAGRGGGALDLEGIGASMAPRLSGILTGEAQMENARVDVGMQAADQMQNLNKIAISLASTIQQHAGPALDKLTGKIAELAAAASGVTWSGSGAGGGSK